MFIVTFHWLLRALWLSVSVCVILWQKKLRSMTGRNTTWGVFKAHGFFFVYVTAVWNFHHIGRNIGQQKSQQLIACRLMAIWFVSFTDISGHLISSHYSVSRSFGRSWSRTQCNILSTKQAVIRRRCQLHLLWSLQTATDCTQTATTFP